MQQKKNITDIPNDPTQHWHIVMLVTTSPMPAVGESVCSVDFECAKIKCFVYSVDCQHDECCGNMHIAYRRLLLFSADAIEPLFSPIS